jgi:acyl-CoA synthetase (NDP forming)
VVTASGGQAELILDLASADGLELPPLPAAARTEVERVVGTITGDGNPLDAWGNGDYRTNYPHAFTVLDGNPTTDAIVLCADSFDDAPLGRAERALDNVTLLSEAAQTSSKPHYLMNTRPGVMNRVQVAALAAAGMAMISGTRQGLGAIDKMARWAGPPAAPLPITQAPATALADPMRRTLHEADTKRMLAGAGLPVTRETLVTSREAAREAAHAIGYPVALKVVSDDLPHKTEHGLVALGVADETQLLRTWDVLEKRLEGIGRPVALAGFLVQEMVVGGVEVFAGVARDTDFGLTIAFGLGGVAIELLHDFAMRTLPLRQGDAAQMIAETRGAALLGPVRGGPAADVAAVTAAIESLADFAYANRARIAEIDLNPIKVRPAGQGCVVVDALIVTHPPGKE